MSSRRRNAQAKNIRECGASRSRLSAGREQNPHPGNAELQLGMSMERPRMDEAAAAYPRSECLVKRTAPAIFLDSGAECGKSPNRMIAKLKVVVVMPAYNASQTLERTVAEIDRDIVDEIILVDDCSQDDTVSKANHQGLFVHCHDKNLGYGGNQKSCYRIALERGADIIVMLHPDYQYDPHLVPAMAYMIASGTYDAVLGSRILGGGALRGGMPLYKYVCNRLLTAFQNMITGQKLSEYHTGYRAFSRTVLETLPLEELSNDFVFDNQMICQLIAFGFRIGEISCPTRYFKEASSINFGRSVKYGIGVIRSSLRLAVHQLTKPIVPK